MRALRLFPLPALLALVLTACPSTNPRTEVLLRVTADDAVRDSLGSVRLRVFGGAGEQLELSFEHEEPKASLTWPVQLAIVPHGGDVSRRFRAEVAALDGATVRALARVDSSFLEGETRVLDVHLAAACLDVTCTDDQTCADGACAAIPRRDPATLPTYGEERDAGPSESPDGSVRDGGLDGALPDSALPDARVESDAGDGGCIELEFFADADGDGYGDPATTMRACEMPVGFVANGMDCDDDCEACRPGGAELCDGEADENCNGAVDEGCECAEGTSRRCPGAIDTGACETGMQTCTDGVWSVCVGRVDPTAELCNNIDDDCDGMIDDGISRACGMDTGECASGIETCRAGAFEGCTAVQPVPEVCNGRDDDCDGTPDDGVLLTFYRDADGDGAGNPLMTMTGCSAPAGWVANGDDCNDNCTACRPGGTEVCDGMRDEDCDGTVDEMCACVNGSSRACPDGVSTGACETGMQTCTGGTWGPCTGRIDPVVETCNNVDDDCDGSVDDGVTRTCGPTSTLGICRRGTETCSAGGWGTCVGAVNPRTETCDGVDEDCDGSIDEGVIRTFYRDGDNDGYGVETSTVFGCVRPTGYSERAGDCDDANPGISPGVAEVCDGRDQDCDGRADGMPNCMIPVGCVASVYDRHLYVHCAERVPWGRARDACTTLQAPGSGMFRLVKISDPAENTFVAGLISSGGAWIGLNDITFEGMFRWASDNSGAPFTMWAERQPDDRDALGGEADCVAIGRDMRWIDASCSAGAEFVCEELP